MWTPPALAAVRPLLPRVPTPATCGVGVREGPGWYEVGWVPTYPPTYLPTYLHTTPATGGVGVREGAGWYEVGWWVGGLIGRWNFSQRICCIFIKMPIKICSIN